MVVVSGSARPRVCYTRSRLFCTVASKGPQPTCYPGSQQWQEAVPVLVEPLQPVGFAEGSRSGRSLGPAFMAAANELVLCPERDFGITMTVVAATVTAAASFVAAGIAISQMAAVANLYSDYVH